MENYLFFIFHRDLGEQDTSSHYCVQRNRVVIASNPYFVIASDAGAKQPRVRELVRQTCEAFEIRIISGVVSKDHEHLLVSALPMMVLSEIMRRTQGHAAANFFEEYPMVKKRYL